MLYKTKSYRSKYWGRGDETFKIRQILHDIVSTHQKRCHQQLREFVQLLTERQRTHIIWNVKYIMTYCAAYSINNNNKKGCGLDCMNTLDRKRQKGRTYKAWISSYEYQRLGVAKHWLKKSWILFIVLAALCWACTAQPCVSFDAHAHCVLSRQMDTRTNGHAVRRTSAEWTMWGSLMLTPNH